MISLKKHLDKLAGPEHPFVKGLTMNELAGTTEKNERDTKSAEEEFIRNLNKFLRTNKN